ncbi:MAG: hypothetical protein ACO4AA_04135 [Aquiluna sp.]
MSKKKSKQDLEALKDMAAREALIVDSNEKSQETNAGARATPKHGPYSRKYEEQTHKLLTFLAQGYSKEAACIGAHLNRPTLYKWLSEYPDFAEEVEDAQFMAEGHVLAELRGAIQRKDDTKALMWLLSKLRPDRYGDRKEVEITTKTNDGVQEVVAMFEQTNDMLEDKTDEER